MVGSLHGMSPRLRKTLLGNLGLLAAMVAMGFILVPSGDWNTPKRVARREQEREQQRQRTPYGD